MIVANWKMHLGIRESVALAKATMLAVQGKEDAPRVVICPAFTALADVRKVTVRSRVSMGAQDVGPARFGAFTGAVGIGHLEDLGCEYVLLGHSERRIHFGETDELLREKMTALLEERKVRPILCVGETVQDGGEDAYEEVVRMVRHVLASQSFDRGKELPIIAYEPVFAIGSGVQPSIEHILRMVQVIREEIAQMTKKQERVTVLYGGSVHAENAYDLLREPEIDGVLVGGASLRVKELQGIIEVACDVMRYQA